METNLKRAAIYARFSSEGQREESIDAQIRACKYYALKENMAIGKIYSDRAKTGKRVNGRTEFLKMIEDGKKGMFNVVLVHKLNRFGRDSLDTLQYKRILESNHVSLVSVTEKLDNSPEGKLMLMVITGMNEFYSANLANEVMKGLKENAYSGKHTGGIPPLGYTVNTETRLLEVHKTESQAVRLIFERYVNNYGYTAIIDELNARGYKTKRGRDFGKNSIYEILRNEKYTGIYVYNRCVTPEADGTFNRHKRKDDSLIIRTEGTVPVIIERELFDRAQKKLAERQLTKGRFKAKETYLLSGKIRCGDCNSLYTGLNRPARPEHGQYVSYRCSKHNGSIKCKNPEISRNVLEGFILDKLASYAFDESRIPIILDAYESFSATRDKDGVYHQEQLKQQLQAVIKSITNIVDMIVKTGSESLSEKLKNLENEKRLLELSLKEYDKPNAAKSADKKILVMAFRKAKKLLKSGKVQNIREVIEQYVDWIVVHKEHIEVYFSFGFGDHEKDKKIPQNPAGQSNDSTVFDSLSTVQIDSFNGRGRRI